ncbi:MAG: TauD/TfdA family dioxygenase [Bacteroidia bacterium]
MKFFASFNKDESEFSDVFKQYKVVQILLRDNQVVNTETYFRKLAEQCGIPLVYEEDPVSGAINLNKWTEIKYDPQRSADTYKHSNTSQPLHTDYGYFSFEIYSSFFYCVAQSEFGGATTFIDVDAVANLLKTVNNSLFERVQKHKIHFGRKDNPIANNDDFILSKDKSGWKINWNYYRALGDTQNKTLIEDFKNFLDVHIEKSGELKEIKLQPGEGIFFHDRRVLHGRNSFFGNRQLNKGAIAEELPEGIINLIAHS